MAGLERFTISGQEFIRVRSEMVQIPGNPRPSHRTTWMATCKACGKYWEQTSRGIARNPSRFARRRCDKCIACGIQIPHSSGNTLTTPIVPVNWKPLHHEFRDAQQGSGNGLLDGASVHIPPDVTALQLPAKQPRKPSKPAFRDR